jgi:hypothetical protein
LDRIGKGSGAGNAGSGKSAGAISPDSLTAVDAFGQE